MAVRRTLVLVSLAAALGGSVAACGGGDDPRLAALELEELANFVAPGGTIEHDVESDGDVSVGESGHALISRVFAYHDAGSASAGRQAAIEAARASGWLLVGDAAGLRDSIFGAKTLSTGDVTLTIDHYKDGGLYRISIRLEHAPCQRCKIQGDQQSSSEAGPDERPSGKADVGQLPLSGSIIVLPNRPNAWAAGPYVTRLGESIELDGSGSYDPDGRIVSYEWDLDGDGDFDLKTSKPNYTYTFRKAFDGKITLRVTDDDGRTAVATGLAHASSDGDEVPSAADNCPEVTNHGQSDFDLDGVGDACDPTPFTRDGSG